MVAVPYLRLDGGVRFDSFRPVPLLLLLLEEEEDDSPMTFLDSMAAILMEGFLLGLGLGERLSTAEARRGLTTTPLSEARGRSRRGATSVRCETEGVLGAEETFSGAQAGRRGLDLPL